MGVELGGWSFGAQFGDLNNDGNLDLYLTNGYVSANRGTSYWYDFSKVAGGNTAIISDAMNWPSMEGRSLSGYQQKCVWINDGAGKFTEVAQAVGATDTYDGRSVAVADFWNRGVLDVVVASQRGPLLVYKNFASPENKLARFRARRRREQPERNRCPGAGLLEWRAASAGSLRGDRFLRAEPAPTAFWLRQSASRGEGHHSMAFG